MLIEAAAELFVGSDAIASMAAGARAVPERFARWASARAAAKDAGLVCETVTEPDALGRLADDWAHLAAASAAPIPFQNHAWADVFARSLDEGALRVVVVRSEAGPHLVLPLVVAPWAGCRVAQWLGEPSVQYGDAVTDAADAAPLLEAAWRAVRQWGDVDAMILRRVRADANARTFLERGAQPVGDAERAPYVDLNGYTDLDDFRARSSAHARRRRRADRRKLGNEGTIGFTAETGSAARAAYDEAIALKRAWLEARGLVSDTVQQDEEAERLGALVDDPASGAVVSSLTLDGRRIAIELGFRHGTHYCAYMGATDDAYARYGPGKLQMEDTIGWCIAEGLTRYDLLAPADPYKLSWTGEAVEVRDYAVALSGRGAALLTYYNKVRPRLKQAWTRMPVPARKMLASLAGRARA